MTTTDPRIFLGPETLSVHTPYISPDFTDTMRALREADEDVDYDAVTNQWRAPLGYADRMVKAVMLHYGHVIVKDAGGNEHQLSGSPAHDSSGRDSHAGDGGAGGPAATYGGTT